MTNPDDKLEETKKMLAQLQEQMNEVTEAKREVDTDIRAEHRKLAELNSKELVFRNMLSELKDKFRVINDDLKKWEQEAKVAAENKRIADEYQRQIAELDELMMQFHWFEPAKPHQLEGAKKLAIAHKAVLGDKRGLGKTLTAIAACDIVGARKILAIVPNDVMGNFQREVHYWAPHRSVHIIGGTTRKERRVLMDFFKMVDDVFLIVNYEAWRKDFKLLDELAECKFDTLIIDEAHNIKEMDTNAFRGVKEIAHAENACGECGSTNFDTHYWDPEQYGVTKRCFECGYVQKKWGQFNSIKNIFPMTGTPILNRPQDIFPLLHIVNPIVFNDKKEFLYTYCELNRDRKWVFQYGGQDRLAKRLGDMYIARDRKQAGVEIPKQTVQVHDLKLDPELYPEQYLAYKTLSERSALLLNDMLSEEENKGLSPVLFMIALITRQRQMITWPKGIEFRDSKTKDLLFQCDVSESVKLDYIIDRNNEGLIPQFVEDEQERVVIFSQFKQPLIELERRIRAAGISVVRYDGDTPRELRQQVQIDFDRKYQNPDKPPRWDVVLAHYKTGGVGLNLNAATQMIILDEEWNPGKEDQAFGRIDRMGQDEETSVHVLRVKHSIDVWLANLIKQKADMIAGFESAVDLEQQLCDIILNAATEIDKEDDE